MTKVTRQRKTTVAARVAVQMPAPTGATTPATTTATPQTPSPALPTLPLPTAALAARVDAPAPAAKVSVAHSPAKPGKTGKHHGRKAVPAQAEPAAKPTAKPAAKAAAKPAADAKPKAKLVRDSFTMPKAEYELLAVLKQRGTQLQRHVKKSELLRAGIAALHSMSDKNFLLALDRAPSLKTGRPKADASTDDGTAG